MYKIVLSVNVKKKIAITELLNITIYFVKIK